MRFASLIFSLALAALSARAQLVVDFVGGDDLAVGPGTAGYEFTTSRSLTLLSLGVWSSSETLFNAHTVGVWDATTHALLRSVAVSPLTAVEVDGFWYALIAPLTLAPNHDYVLGASYADNDFDFARGNASQATLGGGIALGDALLSTSTGFAFPDLAVPGANLGFFGVNALEFAAAPEPLHAALAVACALVLFSAVRRRGLFASVALAAATLGATAAEPTVTVRAVMDARGAERARLAALLAKQRPGVAAATLSGETAPAANRPPVTPGNTNGNRPLVPPGLAKNYATP